MDSLKSHGMKLTQPRILILGLLEGSKKRHFSINEIYEALVEKGQRLSRGTIYRVLDQFEKSKIVISHHFSDTHVVFELCDIEHHDHMVDSKTGKIVEFYDEIIETRQKEIAKEHGFKLIDHRLIMYGNFVQKD